MNAGLAAALFLSLSGPALADETMANFADRKATYRSKNSNGQQITLTIPYIDTDNTIVARRINAFLHDHLLATLPDPSSSPEKNPRVVELEIPMEEMNSEGVQLKNNGRTVSVSVFTNGCGAYCSESTTTYNFDTRNGRLIVSQEMLTPAGSLALAKQMVKLNAARLKKEIARLDKQIASRKPTKERSLQEMEEQSSIYEQCLEERFSKEGGLYPYYIKDPGVMEVGDGSLSFVLGECAGHSNRALDDLGEFHHTLKGEDMRPYLSAYGRYIMLGEGDGNIPAVNPFSQYFKGTINGNIPVTLFMGSSVVLNGDAPFQGAHYYYDKYRKRIDLSMQRSGNRFELTESASKEVPKPLLRFELKGERLTGQWIGNGKNYPFEAQPL